MVLDATRWSDLPPRLRSENITCKWIDCNGRNWPLTGENAGVAGAMITGPIDGMLHVPFTGIWTKPAYGAPRFERTVSTFFAGCVGDKAGFWSVTTRTAGELWIPMRLAETVKSPLDDDPTASDSNLSMHDLVLAADGDPNWRRPDEVVCWTSTSTHKSGSVRIANRSNVPSWPIFIVEAPGDAKLPDGPNAILTEQHPSVWDLPEIAGLFQILGLSGLLTHGTRDANMVTIPRLGPGEHVLIDTNPANRIAISATDPTDDIWKRFVRNSELLAWLTGSYGDSGLPVLQRFHGQGFSVPIPPRTVATLPMYHSRPGARIWTILPQRFTRAF